MTYGETDEFGHKAVVDSGQPKRFHAHAASPCSPRLKPNSFTITNARRNTSPTVTVSRVKDILTEGNDNARAHHGARPVSQDPECAWLQRRSIDPGRFPLSVMPLRLALADTVAPLSKWVFWS